MDSRETLDGRTYIDLMNDFAKWLNRNRMGKNAQLLYFKLLQHFNWLRWPDSAQLSNLQLAEMICSTSEKTAREARTELVEAGFIDFKQGVRGYPSEYRLARIEKPLF